MGTMEGMRERGKRLSPLSTFELFLELCHAARLVVHLTQ